jgi:Cof subfamily protein (haloacid dehalogenase superfamily)
MSNYKMIAVDIDGTLLNSKSELTDVTRDAMAKAMAKGTVVVISSGRPTFGMDKMLKDIGINENVPLIVYNGAKVVMSESNHVIYEQKLAAEYIADLEALAKTRGINMIIWAYDKLYMHDLNEDTIAYQGILNAPYELVGSFKEVTSTGATKAIWIENNIECIISFQREMQERFKGEVNCETSRPYLLEFFDKNASKAIGMQKIGECYGIAQSEMIAVGDADNDISMIEYAGVGVVMGNGKDSVKAFADFIAPTNDEDGLAFVIDKFILS